MNPITLSAFTGPVVYSDLIPRVQMFDVQVFHLYQMKWIKEYLEFEKLKNQNSYIEDNKNQVLDYLKTYSEISNNRYSDLAPVKYRITFWGDGGFIERSYYFEIDKFYDEKCF